MSDDIVDSSEGFFVQSDPIPQTRTDGSEKKAEPVTQPVKTEELTKDTSKTPMPAPACVPSKPPVNTANKPPQNVSSETPKPNNASNGLQQRPKPSQPGPFKPDVAKDPPGAPQEIRQTGPPYAMRGRGQGPLPMQGRGRARGRGQYGGPMGPPRSDPSFQEDVSFDQQLPGENQEDYSWGDQDYSGDDQGPHEIWQPEEHHFPEEYYEEAEEQGPGGPRVDHPEGPEEHWQEEQSPYWEEGDPYWNERRPPMHHRPPFPPGPRRPPFHPRFMPHGPRRPPPPGGMEHDPHGPPHIHRPPMGPRFRRGAGPWGPLPHHEMMGRGIRRPPPPHEILARDPMAQPGFHDEMDGEHGWPPHPHGREPRHPPLLPHERMERDMRRPPMRPAPMLRERWQRPPPPVDDSQAAYEDEYASEYGAESDGYRRPTPGDYRPRDYGEDEEYHRQREDWARERPDHDFHPHPPPERLREDPWMEARERLLPYEDETRIRAERRGPGYADGPPYRDREPPFHSRPDWERSSSPPPPLPLPERTYPHHTEEPLSLYGRNPELTAGHAAAPPAAAHDAALDQSSPGAAKAVLALSQRQHEIILKAAQELKMIRYVRLSNLVPKCLMVLQGVSPTNQPGQLWTQAEACPSFYITVCLVLFWERLIFSLLC